MWVEDGGFGGVTWCGIWWWDGPGMSILRMPLPLPLHVLTFRDSLGQSTKSLTQ